MSSSAKLRSVADSASAPPASRPAPGSRSQEPARIVFDTEHLPERERFDVFRELSRQLIPGFLPHPTEDPNFSARVHAVRAGDIAFCIGEATSTKFGLGSAPHAPSLPQHADVEGVLWIYLQGETIVEQGSVSGTWDAGSAGYFDAEMPGVGQSGPLKVLGVNIPSGALRRVVGHNKRFAPVSLGKDNPVVQLLAGYAASTTQLPEDTDPAVLTSVGSHMMDLVGLALGSTRDAAEEAKNRGLKSARVDAVLRIIKANFTDPAFSVADVASKLGVSVRYVQDILQETGVGFTERVLELRLQEACELLSRAHITNRKVSDIAFSCGFNNLSYFHRAFRRRYGMTPAGAKSD